MKITFGIDNNVRMAINGNLLGLDWTRHTDCPKRDDYFWDVPQTFLKSRGSNVLAVLAEDRGAESWIDLRMTVDPIPLCAAATPPPIADLGFERAGFVLFPGGSGQSAKLGFGSFRPEAAAQFDPASECVSILIHAGAATGYSAVIAAGGLTPNATHTVFTLNAAGRRQSQVEIFALRKNGDGTWSYAIVDRNTSVQNLDYSRSTVEIRIGDDTGTKEVMAERFNSSWVTS